MSRETEVGRPINRAPSGATFPIHGDILGFILLDSTTESVVAYSTRHCRFHYRRAQFQWRSSDTISSAPSARHFLSSGSEKESDGRRFHYIGDPDSRPTTKRHGLL
jgi:hypothetical protein